MLKKKNTIKYYYKICYDNITGENTITHNPIWPHFLDYPSTINREELP